MKPKNKKTKISCHADNAKAIYVAGTFNEWNAESIPLKKGRNGDWSATLGLAPGRYEFKFIVDGQWCCKPGCDEHKRACPDCVPNDCGTMNRVLEVR